MTVAASVIHAEPVNFDAHDLQLDGRYVAYGPRLFAAYSAGCAANRHSRVEAIDPSFVLTMALPVPGRPRAPTPHLDMLYGHDDSARVFGAGWLTHGGACGTSIVPDG